MKLRLALLLPATLLGACSHTGELTAENGGGIYSVRSSCPIAGIPAGTGDVTLFNPPGSTDARAIDVTATITDVRNSCVDSGDDVVSTLTFTVTALRRDAGPARQVVLPYFDVALQGGSKVVAKQIGQLGLNFPAGGLQAWTRAQATVRVNRGVASLPGGGPADPDPAAQGRRGRGRGRSDVRSGDPHRGRQCDLRASGRLPDDPGPAALQRDALTWAAARGQGGRVTGGKPPEGRAGECDAKGNRGSPPKEQPPPESLRHQGPRAPDSLERACHSLVRRRAAEGAKLSGAATDGGDGRTAFAGVGCRHLTRSAR